MNFVWILEETGEAINSGWGAVSQAGEAAMNEALQGVVTAGLAVSAWCAAGVAYLFGSQDQGSQYPTQQTYYLEDGSTLTISVSWSCGWYSQGGGWPPAI